MVNRKLRWQIKLTISKLDLKRSNLKFLAQKLIYRKSKMTVKSTSNISRHTDSQPDVFLVANKWLSQLFKNQWNHRGKQSSDLHGIAQPIHIMEPLNQIKERAKNNYLVKEILNMGHFLQEEAQEILVKNTSMTT